MGGRSSSSLCCRLAGKRRAFEEGGAQKTKKKTLGVGGAAWRARGNANEPFEPLQNITIRRSRLRVGGQAARAPDMHAKRALKAMVGPRPLNRLNASAEPVAGP